MERCPYCYKDLPKRQIEGFKDLVVTGFWYLVSLFLFFMIPANLWDRFKMYSIPMSIIYWIIFFSLIIFIPKLEWYKQREENIKRNARSTALIIITLFICHCVLWTLNHKYNISLSSNSYDRGEEDNF
jgi:hypothetical protein